MRMEEAARAIAGDDPGGDAGPPPTAPPCRLLHATKLEGAGNDFLVLFDPAPRGAPPRPAEGPASLSADEVRMLCDRRRGIGADGLIVGRVLEPDGPAAPGQARLAMTLYNADGTLAEMSGNGIRCLVHAAVGAGLVGPGRVVVRTDAGVRAVDYHAAPGEATGGRGGTGAVLARVDMGAVRLGAAVDSPLQGTTAVLADVGNPHLVVLGDVDLEAVDLVALARAGEVLAGQPVNVEVVRAGTRPGTLEMRVYERGVGETAACGTGTCAAAAVARRAGLVGDHVVVVNPGGPLEVDFGGGDGAPVYLGGPVRKVAEVYVELAALGGAA